MFKKSSSAIDSGSFSDFSIFSIVIEYVTNNLITWVLFVLSIVNTIAYALAIAVHPILLSLSVIPMFYNIQKSLFLYVIFCFLFPVCVGAIVGVFDYIITDDFDQFPILIQLGFSLGFMLSLGFSMKYVYNVLTGDGFSQTVSSAGQSMANMATMWVMGTAVSKLVNGPRDYVGQAIKNKTAQMGGQGYRALKSGVNSRQNLIGKSLDKSGATYADIARNGAVSASNNKMIKAVGLTSPNELKSIREFSREQVSKDAFSGNQSFSHSAYQDWKNTNATTGEGNRSVNRSYGENNASKDRKAMPEGRMSSSTTNQKKFESRTLENSNSYFSGGEKKKAFTKNYKDKSNFNGNWRNS